MQARWVKFSRVSMLPNRGPRFLTIPRDFLAFIRWEDVRYRTYRTGVLEYSTVNVASRIKMLDNVIQLCAAYLRLRSARLFRTLQGSATPNTVRDSQFRCNKVGRDVKAGLEPFHGFYKPCPARAYPHPAQSRECQRAAPCAKRRLAALSRSRPCAGDGAQGATAADHRRCMP
jgi:hypothetical protein